MEKINLLFQLKKIFWVFVVVFLFSFLVLNLLSFFNLVGNKINTFLSAPKRQELARLAEAEATGSAAPEFAFTEKENSLEISKLGITAPLIFSESKEIPAITENLKKGVAVYPGSALPGHDGQIIILGHSAPAGWPKIRYEWVFSKLGDLAPGDEVLLNFEYREYRYLITKKIFLDRGEEIPARDKQDGQFLYLVTCWPPGRDLRRLAIEAHLTK
ncbi:MAG: sortase [bacterium]|nr:sortase [bacterium]